MDRHFTQRDVQMARDHEKMLIINCYREMKIKTTMCCDYILTRIAKIKPLRIARMGEAVEQPELL